MLGLWLGARVGGCRGRVGFGFALVVRVELVLGFGG